MILCLITYLLLPSLKFYQFYNPSVENTDTEDEDISTVEDESGKSLDTDKTDENKTKYFRTCVPVLRRCWTQCYNVFMVFFVTLSVFPAVMSNVKVFSHDFLIQDPNYFVQIVCFLTFNLFAFFGNLCADWVQWVSFFFALMFQIPKFKCKAIRLIYLQPKHPYLWIAVTLRLIFIPFFLICNFQPTGFVRSHMKVLIGDWVYWIGGVFLGWTNGYFSSLALMYCPRWDLLVINFYHVFFYLAYLIIVVFVIEHAG